MVHDKKNPSSRGSFQALSEMLLVGCSRVGVELGPRHCMGDETLLLEVWGSSYRHEQPALAAKSLAIRRILVHLEYITSTYRSRTPRYQGFPKTAVAFMSARYAPSMHINSPL